MLSETQFAALEAQLAKLDRVLKMGGTSDLARSKPDGYNAAAARFVCDAREQADALRAVIAEARQARELREALAASEALLEDSEGDARAIWVAVVGPRNRALLEEA